MKKKITFLLLFVLLGVSLFFGVRTYAKYVSSASGNGSIMIAVPIIENNTLTTIPLDLNEIAPGDTKEYTFKVTNYEGDKLNEVKMNYSIKIDKSSNVPVEIKLFKNSGTDNVLTELESTNNILGFESKQDDTYKLVINWDSSLNDYTYKDLPDYLDIIITGVQVVD